MADEASERAELQSLRERAELASLRSRAGFTNPAESHAPVESANPSDKRAEAAPEGWGHYLAKNAFRAINPLGSAVMEYNGGDPAVSLANVGNSLTLKNAEYAPGVKSYLEEQRKQYPGSSSYGSGIGSIGAATAAAAATPAGIIPMALSAGAQGLATKPAGDNALEDDLKMRGKQGAFSTLLAGGLGIGAKGILKGGDWMMQRAVGRTKYTPGVGTTLADEGIVGTENQMRDQVSRAKEAAYGSMLKATAGNPAGYDSMPVAQNVMNLARSKQVPGAAASSLDQPYINEVANESLNIGSRGLETLSQMLRRRAAAGARGWSSVTDAAKRGVNADISKAEQIGYSDILKNAAPEIAPADKAYSALARASHSLKPESAISQGGNVLRPPPTMWSTLLDFLPSSVVESLLGQAMVKGGQAAPATIPAITSTATRQKGNQ